MTNASPTPSLWEFRLRYSDGTQVEQTVIAEGADETSAADSATTVIADHPGVALARPGRKSPPEVEARWREVFGDDLPGVVSDTGRMALYARADEPADRAAALKGSIEALLDEAAAESRTSVADGDTARAEDLTFGIEILRRAMGEAGAPSDADYHPKLLLALQLGLNRRPPAPDAGSEDVGEALVLRAQALITEAIRRGIDVNRGAERISRRLLDRLIQATLAAERGWATRAKLRGESQHARLALDGVAAAETAIRRARDGVGDYGIRLVAELSDLLADLETRGDDEDGYGSSSVYRVIGLIENVAAAGVDEGPTAGSQSGTRR